MKKNEIVSDDFMEWEERDENQISLFKHCICGTYNNFINVNIWHIFYQ